MKKSPFDSLDWWTGATGVGCCFLLEEISEFYLKHKIPIGVKVLWLTPTRDSTWNPVAGEIIWLKFEAFIKNYKVISNENLLT